MKKHFVSILVIGMVGALLFGCAGQQMQSTPISISPHEFDAAMYAPKVESFMVIFDASSSMDANYNGQKKFYVAKAVAEAMNMTLPELDYTAALRGFGFSTKITRDRTMLFYGPSAYSTAGFQEGLDKIFAPGGTTPMTAGLEASSPDLAELEGRIALIVISDGMATDSSPVMAAEALKAELGERLCIYTVLVGDDPAGMATMDGLVTAGGCGFGVNADDILSTDGMADFVEKIFLEKTEIVCLDADGDGVCDDVDKCLGTPAGARVDENGCWILGEVLFDFDKSNIKAEAYPLLDEVAVIMANNPGLNVLLEGHTDSVGSEAYNMGLSRRRAEAVKTYLVNKGISSDQMATVGYGESKPKASNATKEGRALNRRTAITPEL